MANRKSAYVHITAQVFIPEDEIEDLLDGQDADEGEELGEEDAFVHLAHERINEHFEDETHMKLRDYKVDLSTYE